MSTYTISGKIIRQSNLQPIPKLYIEAWDKNELRKESLASTITDSNGMFMLPFNENYIGELYDDRYPDIYFKVFAGRILIVSTESSVVVNLRGNTNDVIITLDYVPSTERAETIYTVRGTILQSNYSPASGYTIEVCDKGIINDRVLAKERINEQGFFETTFNGQVITKAGKESPDLFLRVLAEQKIQHTTDVVYNASSVTTFNEVIGGALFPQESEFEMLDKKLKILMRDIKIEAVKQDVTNNPYKLLSEKTGSNEQQMKWYVTAHQIAGITPLPPAFFYGLMRGQLATEYVVGASGLVNRNMDEIITLLRAIINNDNIGEAFIAQSQQPEAIIQSLILLPENAVPEAFDFSISNNIIPAQLQARRDELLKQWSEIAAQYQNRDQSENSFQQLLGATQLNEDSKKLAAGLFTRSKGNINELFSSLDKSFEDNDSANEVKTMIAINDLINDPKTSSAVKSKLKIDQPGQIKRLAALSVEDLQNVLTTEGSSEKWPEEKIKQLKATLEGQYPTAAFAGKLKTEAIDSFTSKDHLLKFFDTFPDAELHKTNLDAFFQKNTRQIAAEFKDDKALKKDLKKIQRVFRLAPNFETTKALLDKQITSSQAIYNLGKKRFTETVSDKISKEEANKIYNKAQRSHAASLAIIGEMKSLERGSSLKVLPDVYQAYDAAAMKDFPDLKTLFTSPDICQCEDCRNVYSPAAYLADLLKYLDKRGSTTPMQSAKTVLFQRRPDLGEIDLNCDNSNTAIQYIDLVCEVLEDTLSTTFVTIASAIEPLLIEGLIDASVVAEFTTQNLEIGAKAAVTTGDATTWFVRDEWHTYKIEKSGGQLHVFHIKQTHGTTAERKAMPEYINYFVYDTILKNEKHPFQLPFDLGWEETRAYLDKIGIQRPEWMEAFQNKTVPAPTDLEIAAAFTGISPAETDIIITDNTASQHIFWGGLTDIDKVSVFLQKSGLEYTQLPELLLLDFINPSFDSKIVHKNTTCDTENKTISNLDNKLDRINRFLRLWRKTSWKMTELDKAIMNARIGNGVLDGNFLVHLKSFMELETALNKPVSEVAAYYEDLDISSSTSIYYFLFQNKIILNPLPDAFKAGLVTENPFPNPVPAAPDGSLRTVTGQIKSLAAVLKLKEEEALLIQSNSITNDNLSLSNISTFYRIASLTRKLRLSVQEYYILLEILNTGSAFDVFQDPGTTNNFIDVVALIRSAKFNMFELAYLLLHEDKGSRPLIPSDDIVTAFITTGRETLQKVNDDLNSITGLPDDMAKTLIAKIATIDDAATNETIQIFNGTFTDTTIARDIFLDALYGAIIDTSIIKTRLNDRDTAVAADKDQKTLDAYQTFDELILAYLAKELYKQAIYQLHEDQFKFPADISRVIMDSVHLQGTTDPLITYWFDTSLLAKDVNGNYINALNAANFPDLYSSYQLLNKIAVLQSKLPFNVSILQLLLSNAGAFGVLSFDELPVIPGAADSHFAKWQSYVQLYQFSSLYPDNDTGTLAAVLQKLLPVADTEANFLEAFAHYTLWDVEELIALKIQLGFTYPADYLKIQTFTTLDQCYNLLVASIIKAAQIPLIINPSPVSIDAINVKQLVKSKYDNDQWLNTCANLQEILREKKRDALLAYFTHNSINGNTFKDADELYNYYLLDTEMGAKEITTRILQANLSIQLFVQRCLMNLEAEIVADSVEDNGWNQWEWMKYYQVWAANRKVFLYPENWIEPELRPDKSPFFEELESDLMQNELNKDNVEKAYLSYLEKLDNVARLDVSGYYYEEETYTLHVFARTYDDPNIYYYRKWVEDRYWTAWEKLDLEIATTQVIPVIINRRIHLYWPEFRDQSVQPTSTDAPNPGDKSFPIDTPYKFWEIHLAVSELRNDKWTPKKISKTSITSSWSKDLYNDYPKENFSFVPLDMMNICDRYLVGCYLNTTPDDATNFYTQPVDFFDLGSCHGTPEVLDDYKVRNLIRNPILPQFERSELKFLESEESNEMIDDPNDALAYQQGNLFINHIPILQITPGSFRAPQPAQLSFFDKLILKIYWAFFQKNNNSQKYERGFAYPTGTFLPFFYEDKGRTFFVPQEIILSERSKNTDKPLQAELFYSDIIKIIQEIQRTGQLPDILKPFFANGQWPAIAYRLKFSNFYHPYVCFLIKQLYMNGIDGMLRREVQLLDQSIFSEIIPFDFSVTYSPTWVVNKNDTRVIPNPKDPDTILNPGYPKETMDFNAWGSYAEYNWELFYHAPMMVAERLSSNQQFEDAMHWYHYIFNPTDASPYPSPQRFWNTKPFFVRADADYLNQRIDQILTMINSGNTELIKDVDDWRNDPFQPHLIAQFRTVAYQKTTVMKYLDNLIAWGDNLYLSDTRENITAATQLYILAAEILGKKPKTIPNFFDPPVLNYNQLAPKLDTFANAIIDVENFIPYFADDVQEYDDGGAPLPDLDMFYFCIPPNDKMLTYWDMIADRLFKIRHSMNIEGIERQLALFDPPIDPGLLVKAVGSGVSIGAAIAGLHARLPNYRFTVCLQKANEFCSEVKLLATSLLSALEKRDAEAMLLLRSTQEIRMLEAVKLVRKTQIDEANANIESLNKTRDVTLEKLNYYNSLDYMNAAEIIAFSLSSASTLLDAAIAAGYLLAGGLKAIPQFIAGGSGFGGSPHVTVEIGGKEFGDAAEIATKTISAVALALDKGASLASTQGSYQRRKDEWNYQSNSASKEIKQIEQQITAAQIRLDIARKEYDNQQLQIDNAKETDQLMRSKFTNQQLYEWMITQISGVYFQSYQLAFDMAKRAEKSYQYELGIADGSFIQFGYWDSLKKGLLSGDKLSLDLKRMDSSYYDKNKREFEITKHISLNQVDPLALLKLKQNGVCFFNVPEELFDIDYPGHYFRRIKSAALTIPCIIGPYNNVNCTLSILKSRIRVSADAALVDYSTPPTENDAGFTFNFSAIQQIVTSNGQMDNGMFDGNLRDERYLPFEGHGATSQWKLELNKDFQNFDFNTISDVILHLRYTARQAGSVLAEKVKSALKSNFDQIIKTYEDGTGFFKLLSMRSDFSTEFHQLLYPAGGLQQVSFNITQNHVPYWLSGKSVDIDDTVPVTVFLKLKAGQTVNLNTLNMQVDGQVVSFAPPVVLGELKQGSTHQTGALIRTWNIASLANALDPAIIDDILILIKYRIV